MLRVKVFSARQYDRNFLSGAVKEHKECGVEWDFEERALSAETAETAKGFEGVCLFVNDTLTGETARAMYGEGLRLVLLRCAGFDGVDTKTCAELGVRVMRVPSYSPPAVAEFAVASLLSFVRHLPRAVARAREQNFALDGLLGFTLHGKTVGVIGTGGIGQCFVRIMAGFGPKQILAFDVSPSEQLAKEVSLLRYVSLEEVASSCDVISVHVPLLPSTHHLVAAALLAKMRPHAVLVNTSRGALVHTHDLLAALKAGKLAGYCGDVYENERALFFADRSDEPLADDTFAVLSHMPQVQMTAHCAFFAREAIVEIAAACLENAASYRDKKPSKNDVK